MSFKLGWKRQPKDNRDFKFKVSRRLQATVGPTTDLIDTMSLVPQLNQALQGSCGPNSESEMIQFDQALAGQMIIPPSRQEIYYNCRVMMNTIAQDSGIDNRTLMSSVQKYGYVSEALIPYDYVTEADAAGNFPPNSPPVTPPSPELAQQALANCIDNYAAVAQDLDSMKGTLATGHVFLFGFDCFKQIMSDAAAATGILTEPIGTPVGGHDVTICGYTDVELPGLKPGNVWPANTFRFRNHWLNSDGTPWGDEGYGYISYDYATGPSASDFWVVNALATSVDLGDSIFDSVPLRAAMAWLRAHGYTLGDLVTTILKNASNISTAIQKGDTLLLLQTLLDLLK